MPATRDSTRLAAFIRSRFRQTPGDTASGRRNCPVFILFALGLLSGALFPAAFAQTRFSSDPEYLIDTWETDHGLAQNSPTAMVQTPDGYLWFSTFDGLARFNGVEFLTLRASQVPQIADKIANLHLDRRGRLWISTIAGLSRVKDGQWRVFTPGKDWIGSYVRYFAEGKDGTLYALTFENNLLRVGDDSVEELPRPPGNPAEGIFPFVDDADHICVATPRFVGRLVAGQWEPTLSAGVWAGEEHITSGVSRDGGLWIVTKEKVRKFRGGVLAFEGPGPGEKLGVWRMEEHSSGELWFGTFDQGLYRFRPDPADRGVDPARSGDPGSGSQWRRFTPDNGLASLVVRFALEDREGSVWVGTDGGGLQRFKRRTFRTWGREHGLADRLAYSLAEDRDGSILAGMQNQGVVRLQHTNVTRLELPGTTNRISGTVYAVLVDSRGRTWAGTQEEGLYLIDGRTWRRFSSRELRGSRVYCLFEDSSGRVWIGTDRSLCCYDHGELKLRNPGGPESTTPVRTITENKRENTLWVATDRDGVWRLDQDRFVLQPETAQLTTNIIISLHADPDGTVWIGTLFNGLSCLRQGRLTRLLERQAPPYVAIGSILDEGANLWFTTELGIVRMPRAGLEAALLHHATNIPGQLFDASDGLATRDIPFGRQPNAIRDRAGRLWFATTKGVAMTDPSRLRSNGIPPSVVIEKVVLDDQTIQASDLFITSTHRSAPPITIPAGTKRVEIHYAGLSFVAAEKVRYRYRLGKSDADWIDAGNRRAAYLQDLDPGRYQFQVNAANNDGVWHSTGATLAFHLEPLWHQTALFRGTIAITAALLAAAGYRLGVRRIEQRRAELEQRVIERTAQLQAAYKDLEAFSYSVSHDLRAPLRSIDGFSESLLEDYHDRLDAEGRDALQRVRKATQRMEGLIDDMLMLSQISRQEMHTRPVALSALAQEIANELRTGQPGRDAQFVIAPDLMVRADANLMRIALANLLGNAWKYTSRKPGAKIEFGAVQENGERVFFVRDNGAGFDMAFAGRLFGAFQRLHPAAEFEGTGIGLATVHRVIQRHGGRVWAKAAVDQGATFYFTVPN